MILLPIIVSLLGQPSQPTLDELLNLEPPTTQPADAQQPPTVEIDPELQRMLETGSPGDVLESAVADMGDVAARLSREQDPGLQTQRSQEQIIRKLDQVIAAVRQQEQQSSSSSSSSSSNSRSQDNQAQSMAQQGQQASASSERSSTPSSGQSSRGSAQTGQGQDQLTMQELRDSWGNLPARLRDELSEGYSERFSPLYRQLTEQYYRRLAQEQQP